MNGLRAKVEKGRIVLDQPTSLPEGTTLDLVLDDEGDDLSPEERRILDRAIAKAWESAKMGRMQPGEEVIRQLRSRP